MIARYTNADQHNAAADASDEEQFRIALIQLLDRIALALEVANNMEANHPSRI